MIEFQNVRKTYGKENCAVKEASFKIEQGEFVFLVGPSGAGKSTLLKMIYKEEIPTSGNIMIFHRDIKKIKTRILRRHLGIVFQDFDSYLLKNKTAYENVAYVLESQGQNIFKIKNKVMEALEKMGIADKKKNRPNELSGGEKQRLMIARAIVNKPEIIICDEPTGNLDDERADEIINYLNQLNQEGATIVMSTHSKRIIERENRRIIQIEEGKVLNGIIEITDDKKEKMDLLSLIEQRDNRIQLP